MPAAAPQAESLFASTMVDCRDPGQTELRMMLTFCATDAPAAASIGF